MSSESDRLLIDQIRAGDDFAWFEFIQRYEKRLIAYIHRRINDLATCEDLVQETFIGFQTSLPNYDINRKLDTYLFRIASNKLTDHLRKSGRHPLKTGTDSTNDLLHQQLDEKLKAASSIARKDEKESLESKLITRFLLEWLDNYREKGDYTRIKVLELLWVKGWPNREVAEKLGVSEQQVANYRFSAVKKLKQLLLAENNLNPDIFPELQSEEPLSV